MNEMYQLQPVGFKTNPMKLYCTHGTSGIMVTVRVCNISVFNQSLILKTSIMKHLSRTIFLLLTGIAIIALQACQENDMADIQPDSELKKAEKTRTFYGPSVEIGDGVGRAYVVEDESGNPVEVGLNLSAQAMENLPHHHEAFVLPFHPNKGKRFYDHVLLDWAPQGHEPPGVYDLPHFDVHFYITSVAERESIGFQEDDLDPDGDYIPPTYIRLPGVVPQMGSHWVSILSPELHPTDPEVFTHTFIIGSYNGLFTFWEPMVTREFLLSQPNVTKDIPQPQKWQKHGFYPTQYKIFYSDRPGQYTIALTGLVEREAS